MMHVMSLVALVGRDNGMTVIPFFDVDLPSGFDWEKLDKQAAMMSEDEAITFCCGEESEAKSITYKYDIGYLNDFLNRCFDGDLHDHFYEP